MRRSVKSLMALAMAVSVSASMAVLSGCGAASGSKAQDNAGAANAQTGTAAVNQTGSGAEAGTDTNTDTSTDTGTGSGTGGNSSSGEKTVIEYWHCNAETQGGLVVDELVKQFNESNDHIQVEGTDAEPPGRGGSRQFSGVGADWLGISGLFFQ